MDNLQKIIVIYLIVINVVTFFIYGIDKWKAVRSKWRISEAMLLGLAVIGGSIGAWLYLVYFSHLLSFLGCKLLVFNVNSTRI